MKPTTDEQADRLQRTLTAEISGETRFDKVSRAMYATDASVYQIMPLGVVLPKTREDVVNTVRHCREHAVSITARGGGTSQAGQAIGAGIQLDFSKHMNRVLAVDPQEETVRVEPGIVLDELNAQLKPHGLHLPLDLSTSNRATVGGMIANNSSGTRSVVYGKTLDYVNQLTTVMSDGRVVELGPLDAQRLSRQCDTPDLAGTCHRLVRDLAIKHAEEIEERYPKLLRRVGGYNLDEFVPSEKPFNLAHLIVGSEGTLGLVVEAKLRVVPLPKHRVLCVVQFHELLHALKATPLILNHQPSAVELMDRFVLDATRGKTEFEPLRGFIVDDPGAVLIVEFQGESGDILPMKMDQLEQQLSEMRLGYQFHRALELDAQSDIWKLRKAALGLSMSQAGDAKSISYVEDTAVAPDRLHDYISRFQEILTANNAQAGFYAHASVGLLHIRPVINLKTADGIAKFQRIANQVSDLVLEFGGALSGEHGDGLVRSPFQRKMFGPTLYEAFCQIKRAFDPDGILNPGKIVHAPPLVQNLKFGTDYQTRQFDTVFDFSEFGGISRAAEQCGGVGACRKTLVGTMCPSYMATRDEADSTRGRANALRMAISGQLGSEGLADSSLLDVLDLCLECKACKSECPTGVDMARMKSEFLHQYHCRHGASGRTRLLSNAERVAVWGSRFAPVSNWIAQSHWARWLNDKVYGLDRRRVPPAFSRRTFLDWWKSHDRNNMRSVGKISSQVAIFADTFTNYYEPHHSMAVVQIAERLGAHVVVPHRVCCGRPLISKGFLKQAARQAAETAAILEPLAEQGIPIVFSEPGCFSAVTDDHPHLLRGKMKERAERVAAACWTFEQWLDATLAKRSTNPDGDSRSFFEPGPAKILVHGHCHQKALVSTQPANRLLSRIPGCDVIDADSGCCGMAGSFGYEREHYDISRAVAEQRLLPAVRDREPGTLVVAPGFSCRHQIRHFTGVDAQSPMELLASLLRE
jgi:FAD/FMN-containing dehydrogenase/Fe-S oxidoreductase